MGEITRRRGIRFKLEPPPNEQCISISQGGRLIHECEAVQQCSRNEGKRKWRILNGGMKWRAKYTEETYVSIVNHIQRDMPNNKTYCERG